MLIIDERAGRQHVGERSPSLVGVSEALVNPECSAGILVLPEERLQQFEATGMLVPDMQSPQGPIYRIETLPRNLDLHDIDQGDKTLWKIRQRAIIDYRKAMIGSHLGYGPVYDRFIENLAIMPDASLLGDSSRLNEELKHLIRQSRTARIALAGVAPEVINFDTRTAYPGMVRATRDYLTAADIVGPFVFEQQDDYVLGI